MKIIEGMKKIKQLQLKISDLNTKISKYCAIQSIETPTYGSDQNKKIEEWLQSIHDSLKEILRLRIAIQKTNLATNVTIEMGGNSIVKSIAEWIHRRRDLAAIEKCSWDVLTDRNLKEGTITNSQSEKVDVKIVRFFNPSTRDEKIELYRNEPIIIDSTLEVINAVTDLIE